MIICTLAFEQISVEKVLMCIYIHMKNCPWSFAPFLQTRLEFESLTSKIKFLMLIHRILDTNKTIHYNLGIWFFGGVFVGFLPNLQSKNSDLNFWWRIIISLLYHIQKIIQVKKNYSLMYKCILFVIDFPIFKYRTNYILVY